MQYFVNPIFSVLALMLMFCLTAVSWLLLNAEFLAFTLIFVYVGAIIVLFLFIVMLTEQKRLIVSIKNNINIKNNNILWVIMAASITIGFVIIFIIAVENYSMPISIVINDNTTFLAQTLFTEYLTQFVAVGFMLLSVIVSVVCLI